MNVLIIVLTVFLSMSDSVVSVKFSNVNPSSFIFALFFGGGFLFCFFK